MKVQDYLCACYGTKILNYTKMENKIILVYEILFHYTGRNHYLDLGQSMDCIFPNTPAMKVRPITTLQGRGYFESYVPSSVNGGLSAEHVLASLLPQKITTSLLLKRLEERLIHEERRRSL